MIISMYPNYNISDGGVVTNRRTGEKLKKYEGEDGMVVKLRKDNITYVEYVRDLFQSKDMSKVHRPCRRVKCIETGRIYESVGDCSRDVGCGVTQTLYGRSENHKGLHYVFI